MNGRDEGKGMKGKGVRTQLRMQDIRHGCQLLNLANGAG
jgi:hypothetical protein